MGLTGQFSSCAPRVCGSVGSCSSSNTFLGRSSKWKKKREGKKQMVIGKKQWQRTVGSGTKVREEEEQPSAIQWQQQWQRADKEKRTESGSVGAKPSLVARLRSVWVVG